jgi:arabinose-5-phosphate isomerase
MNHTMEYVKKAISTEIESLNYFFENLDPNIEKAIDLIVQSQSKVILTGVGKSGDIAKKIAATMSSTGTKSLFLHPTDAAHGDLGIVSKGDIVIAVGKSGESEELLSIIPALKNIGATIIGLTANSDSRLAKDSDILIITPVLKEACPLDLAPTSSTTIALVLGDAMAMALMELRGFKKDDFAMYHPAGRLGKRLALKIDDVMRKENQNATVLETSNLIEILSEITSKSVGATSVVDSNHKLIGFITDFDIRKSLINGSLNKETKAKDIMNSKPSFYKSGSKAYDVLLDMEKRTRPISCAPVCDSEGRAVGIIIVHDLLQKGL